jgi:hypothetical protein
MSYMSALGIQESYQPTNMSNVYSLPVVPPLPNHNVGPQGAQNPQINLAMAPTQAIISLEDLMNSVEATSAKEKVDKASLQIVLNPTSTSFKTPLLQWASTGFEPGYIIYTLNLIAPQVCSDGKTRDIGGYILYLTTKSCEEITVSLQNLMPGIKVFHSFLQSTFRLHVSKLQ